MIKTDLHTHSVYSFDGHFSVDDMCRAALDRGLSVLAFTEHFDLSPSSGDGYFKSVNSRRKKEVKECAEKYRDKLLVLEGIELGQPHVNLKESAKVLSENHFDMVIGAVHNLDDGRDVYVIDYMEQSQCEHIMELYLNTVYKTASSADFDTLAHLDFPMRKMSKVYAVPENYTLRPYEEQIREILKVLVKRGKALEVNTRGFICWQNQPCPEKWVLEAYREYGGKLLTVGSDAHYDKYVGLGAEKTAEILKSAGFSAVTYYKDRQPHFMEI